jgi:transcriptional regulator with XRE-family HTH domain
MSLSDVSGNLAERLKKKREQEAAAKGVRPDHPVDFNELRVLRARILGVLIRDARISRNCAIEDCAERIGVDAQTLTQWELGLAHPSLPDLELLAYELGIPISHFWNTKTITGNNHSNAISQSEYTALRNRVVGAMLQQAREAAQLSEQELGERIDVGPEVITAYELGQKPIPMTELTSLASAVSVSLSHFLDNSSRVGSWLEQQEDFRRYQQVPKDVRSFISNPVNSVFVELAMWFSALGVNDLRGIAESILNLSRLEASKMKKIAEGILNDITL